jgi:hypothetical protein
LIVPSREELQREGVVPYDEATVEATVERFNAPEPSRLRRLLDRIRSLFRKAPAPKAPQWVRITEGFYVGRIDPADRTGLAEARDRDEWLRPHNNNRWPRRVEDEPWPSFERRR